MSIRIDEETRTISLGVRDLCGSEALGGSLNLSPLSAARNEMGREVHSAYQATQSAQHGTYLKEYFLRHTMQYGNYSVLIDGRIDGVYEQEGTTVIEEVKSVLSGTEEATLGSVPIAHILQLRIYLYLWAELHPDDNVVGRLVLVRCEPEEIRSLEVVPDANAVRSVIQERLEKIVDEHERSCRLRALKRSRADWIAFPFPKMRKHQDRMVDAVHAALEQERNLLISAPTGIG